MILSHFVPFYPTNNPKNKKFLKKEKTLKMQYYYFTHVFDKWQKFLSSLTLFYPFSPLTTWKIKIFKKWKKQHLEKLPFYTCVPYMKIIWCMVPEIWSAIDRIFCHFRPFFALLTQITTLKKAILKKWRKCLDICHVTQMYQKSWSNDHILNYSWDTRHDRCNFYFSFWDIFCPFPP